MNEQYKDNDVAEIDLMVLLRDFLGIARGFWWLLPVLIGLFVGGLSLHARLTYTPLYQASSTFTIYVANPLQSGVQGYNVATADQMAKTFPYILTSGALKDVVKRELDIEEVPEISASVMENTNIFTLTVRAEEPQLAAFVLDAVITHYPEISEFVVGPTVMHLLDESGVPTGPCNGHYLGRSVRMGLLIGAALWCLAMALLAMMRSTVHNEEELGRLINVRCLGAVPRVKRGRWSDRSICPMLDEEHGPAAFREAVRLLRIRVERELQRREQKVLLISSATPGEGKTTIAINLAKSLTHQGKRVLLVDCDLRNPSVARNLGCENKDGLSDFLSGRISAERALHRVPGQDFMVAVAGRDSEHAAELLSRQESVRFIENCRKAFDYVLLDTPPSSLMADAAEIARAADQALLVIRENYASKAQILEGAQALADSGLPLLGCTMNYTTDSVLTGRSSRYGYGQYYGRYHESAEE